MIASIVGSSFGSRSDLSATPSAKALTTEQLRQIEQLKETDRKVRAHEQAHISVGGDLVRGGATFTYQTGPDDRRYAVSGEVSIDASPGRTPEETIPKAQHIRATALAPADPSPQDRSVAAKASAMEANARGQLSTQRDEESRRSGSSASSEPDRGAADFYQAVAQTGTIGPTVGGWLDSFA